MEQNDQLRGYLPNVVLFKNNCEKGDGIAVAKKYSVQMYPTFAMVDGTGEVTDRWAGYDSADDFIATVDAARADPRPIKAKVAAFAAEPTAALALALGHYSEATSANADAMKYYREAMRLAPSRAKDLRSRVFMAAYYGMHTGEVTSDQLMAIGNEIMDAPESDVNDYMTVAGVVRRVAAPADYVPILRKALKATAEATDPDQQAFHKDLLVDEALFITKDKDAALRLKRASLPDNWRDDPDQLNSFAWWCYQNDLDLNEAFVLAMRGSELATDSGDKANILDTAAEIAFKRGDKAKAIELEAKAVDLAPDRQGLQKTLAKFKDGQAG